MGELLLSFYAYTCKWLNGFTMLVTTNRLVDIGQGREQEQGGKRFKDIITVAGVVRSFTLEGQQTSCFFCFAFYAHRHSGVSSAHLVTFLNLHTASSFSPPTPERVSCGPLIYF